MRLLPSQRLLYCENFKAGYKIVIRRTHHPDDEDDNDESNDVDEHIW